LILKEHQLLPSFGHIARHYLACAHLRCATESVSTLSAVGLLGPRTQSLGQVACQYPFCADAQDHIDLQDVNLYVQTCMCRSVQSFESAYPGSPAPPELQGYMCQDYGPTLQSSLCCTWCSCHLLFSSQASDAWRLPGQTFNTMHLLTHHLTLVDITKLTTKLLLCAAACATCLQHTMQTSRIRAVQTDLCMHLPVQGACDWQKMPTLRMCRG
jgi:hypothetical protein